MPRYMMARRPVVYGMLMALAACGSASVTPSGTPTPTPGIYSCLVNGPPPFTLVAPAPGATSVPDSTAALLFTGSLETWYGPPAIKVTFGAQGWYVTYDFIATDTGYRVPLQPLLPKTTYTVYYLVDVASGEGACDTLTLNEGSFTTQ